HNGLAIFAEAYTIKISKSSAPKSGKADFARNHQCSRTTLLTTSSGCWPEKCHLLSLPKRICCTPKRERPERQSSSCGISGVLACLSCPFALLLIVSPRFVYHSNNRDHCIAFEEHSHHYFLGAPPLLLFLALAEMSARITTTTIMMKTT